MTTPRPSSEVPGGRPLFRRWAIGGLRGPLEPSHVAVAAVAMVAAVYGAGTIEDPDVYWHILIGDQIRSTGSLSGLGADWTVPEPSSPWQTSQWLSEVVASALHQAGGLQALVLARAVVGLVLMLAIAALLLARSTPRAAAVTTALVALVVAPVIQDRPQLASLVLTLWLAWRVTAMLAGARGPTAWEVVIVSAVWAQWHGLWVLAPATFAVLALGRLSEGRAAWPAARRAGLLALLAALGGMLNPLGPKSLLLPLSFAGDTALIQEWSRTSLQYAGTIFFLLLLAIMVTLWARSGTSVPRAELVHVLLWALFGFTAIRNIAPAVLLIAPVVAARLSTTLPRSVGTNRREQRLLAATLVMVMVIGTTATLGRALLVDPSAGAPATSLAAQLGDSPRPLRVFNDYNASGVILFKASDRVTLGIDGRADRLGGSYTERYIDAQDLRGNWRELLKDIRPDAALLLRDRALTQWLVEVQGWKVVRTDGDLVLLARSGEIADDLR